MSLYGLDIVIDRNERPYLIELNGVKSGTEGFRRIYGDNRVQEQVWRMLEEKYGKITVNTGEYRRKQMRKKHPVIFRVIDAGMKLGLQRTILFWVAKMQDPHNLAQTKKAHGQWMTEEVSGAKGIQTPFEKYDGQESTVLNIDNDPLSHPTVNDWRCEEAASNKFLQYSLLRQTKMRDAMPFSVLVGLGLAPEKELQTLESLAECWVQKPILGALGRGMNVLTRDSLQGIKSQHGTIYEHREKSCEETKNPGLMELIKDIKEYGVMKDKPLYVEDLVTKRDFSFEPFMTLVQPFIEGKSAEQGLYYAGRAIVCNGEFVDIYARVAEKKRVNLSQGARAEPWSGPDVRIWCEEVVREFEAAAQTRTTEQLRSGIYNDYFNEVGRRMKGESLFMALLGEAVRVMDVSERFRDRFPPI